MKRKKPKPTILALRRELSPAEYRVFACMLRGYSNEDTAAAIGTALSTVRNQRIAIFRKTGTASVSELMALVLLPYLPLSVRASIEDGGRS